MHWIGRAPQIEMNGRRDVHSRVTTRPDGVQFESALGVRLHVALQPRMADLAVRRIIAILVGVVGINDDSRDGVLPVWRKDAAVDDQRIARLSGRYNRGCPSCVRRLRRRRILPLSKIWREKRTRSADQSPSCNSLKKFTATSVLKFHRFAPSVRKTDRQRRLLKRLAHRRSGRSGKVHTLEPGFVNTSATFLVL